MAVSAVAAAPHHAGKTAKAAKAGAGATAAGAAAAGTGATANTAATGAGGKFLSESPAAVRMELLNDISSQVLLVVLRPCSAALVLCKGLAQWVLVSRLGLQQEGDCFTFVLPSLPRAPGDSFSIYFRSLKKPQTIYPHSL